MKYKDINGDNIIDSNDQCAIGYTREPELVLDLVVRLNIRDLI